MKVFISSVITGFEAERQSATQAARTLGHEVKVAEDFPALADTPQAACLAGVRWADVVILLLGQRYGAVQPSGLSATHEEYREARDRCSKLAFVQSGITPEPQQHAFIKEVQDYTTGALTVSFAGPDELRDAVLRSLHDLELREHAGATDDAEILGRAQACAAHTIVRGGPILTLVVASGPRQPVLRPGRLEDPSLADSLLSGALFGAHRVFGTAAGTEQRLANGGLLLKQESAEIFLQSQGTVRVSRAFARAKGPTLGLSAIIEEDVRGSLEDGLRFIADTLDTVDAEHRLARAVPLAVLEHANQAWRTQAEHAANPSMVTLPLMVPPAITVLLSPPGRHRSALRQDAGVIADDLLVLMRREMKR